MDFTTLDLRIGTITAAAPAGDAVALTISLGTVTVEAESRINETYAAGRSSGGRSSW